MILHKIKLIWHYIIYYSYNLFHGRAIRVYFWNDLPNFGDLITPALLQYYGYKAVHFYPHRAQLVSTGSLIEHISDSYTGVILGTGSIDEKTKTQFHLAKVIGLRGEFTKEQLHISEEISLGDPGLLADRLLKSRSVKKYKLGLIPHYSDVSNSFLEKIRDKYPEQVIIIDVQDEPIPVLQAMDSCEYIMSSSLHGLICADALGIPNRWMQLSELLGGDFKFRDYYSVFNIVPNPIKISGSENLEELIQLTSLVDQSKLVEIQQKLEVEFKSLKKYIHG